MVDVRTGDYRAHYIKDEPDIDESHDMTDWEGTIVEVPGNSRFGSIRRCKKCDIADVKSGGPGSRWVHIDLFEPCPIDT